MERMEVDQCACAAPGGGGTSLRRSNSAPMIPHLSDSSLHFQSCGNRCRRSSVSLNLGCPGLSFPLSPFQLSASHVDHFSTLQGDGQDAFLRGRPQSREAPAALETSVPWPQSCHVVPCYSQPLSPCLGIPEEKRRCRSRFTTQETVHSWSPWTREPGPPSYQLYNSPKLLCDQQFGKNLSAIAVLGVRQCQSQQHYASLPCPSGPLSPPDGM
ncbi:uncharacterized protein LOC115078123 isoform X1 [Rhinatrema bivittatum]|uniref:uncharacterized protein LOC115078123 isoform X1 n=1 Tax=Rhinatrema bivittatum TaxID=194408 RepID=UPI0011281A71|nr:uncharacterized protein LOC115078123 isoform X1 [Rhinatrema bivittatum]